MAKIGVDFNIVLTSRSIVEISDKLKDAGFTAGPDYVLGSYEDLNTSRVLTAFKAWLEERGLNAGFEFDHE